MNISLFTTPEDPFVGVMALEFIKDFKIDSVILDNKKISEKDKQIWIERTNNKIEYIDINKSDDLNLIYVDSHNSDDTSKLIIKRDIDLIINCGTPRILCSEIIDAPNIGILNCHPGILPEYRGCTCVEWALYNQDDVGNTCHLMSKKIDEGPIIFKNKIKIENYDSYQSIRRAVYLNSIDTIKKAIKLINLNKIDNKTTQKKGVYYRPINDEKMNVVLQKYGNEIL